MAGKSSISAWRQSGTMPQKEEGAQRRVLFALAVLGLLLALGASVALADGETSPSQGGPTLSQVEEAIADPSVQRAELPRVDSQAAEELPHRDLTREQANELLTQVFGSMLEGPAGIFDELEVEKFYSDHVALIGAGDPGEGSPEGTQPSLLESTLPLRAEDSSGHEEAVDLGLEKAEGEIQPANPLVEVGMPSRLEEGLSLPQSDIEIELAGAPAERAPSTIDQSIATYPNVAEDTTFAVAPTPTGFETFTLLQSADAPTSQTFNLSLPSGASLEETEDGGAEVRRDGEILVLIHRPSALDANEQPVPVHLETSGDSLTITASPSETNVFPILVDPMWETYYWFQHTTTSFAGWDSFSNSSVFTTSHNGWHDGIWDPGLQIASGNTAITPGAQARWDYHVPRWATDVNAAGQPVKPTSFINRVIFEKLFFDVQAYANPPAVTPDPFFAFYIWDEKKPGFVAIGHRYGTEGNLSNMNYQYNLYNTTPPNENVNAKQASLELVSSQTKSQYRQLYVGLAGIELSDKDFPVFSPLIGPDEWVNNAATPITFTATDSGLGVREISFTRPSTTTGTKKVSTLYSPSCTGGQMSPCPRTWNSGTGPAIVFDPSTMPQGENSITVDAVDPLGQRASQKPGAGSGLIHVSVDHTAPKMAPLSGTLTEQGTIGTNASQYTLKYSASDGDHEAPVVLAPVGSAGTGAGQMQRPMGVAVDGSGNIWVVDRENNRVQKFDESGKFLMQFGTFGSANGQFKDPRGIAISPNGTIWVSDGGNRRVQAFNSNGEFIRVINYAPFVAPYGLTTGPGGVVWVVDQEADAVFEFSETGAFIRKAYGSTKGEGNVAELVAPTSAATDSQGNLWVADGSNTIQKFDQNGKFLFQFGSTGAGNGQFQGPSGITVAESGNLLITDNLNNRVQVFQPSGTYLRQFGTTGSGSGQLKEPRGIAVAPGQNTALVVDAGNRRVARWSHADLDPQSGVASTEVKVDGQLVEPKYAPGCPTKDCAITREWTLKANDYESGQHEVQVTATDGVGLSTTRSLSFSTVKDAAKPKLSAVSPYFTMPKGWREQKTYSYSVSVTDTGGHGVTSFVYKIDNKVVKSVTQSCPNGGCGATLAGSIDIAAYEGGAHPGELIATDAAGNTLQIKGTLNVAPKGTISAAEAAATLDAVDTTSESQVVASTDEAVDPIEQEAGNEPGLEKQGDVLESTGTPNQSTIAIDPSEGFTIESPNGPIQAEPVLTNEASTPMLIAEGVAATTANVAGNVDTVIRPVFNGLFDYQSIRNSTGPEAYSWDVQLGKNQILRSVDSQHALVEYENGDVAYSIVAEPAHDAIGTTVPTSLSVSGSNIVTLTVSHKNGSFVYPVIGGTGWQGGFTTSLAVMPPAEQNQEIFLAQGGGTIGPPIPLPIGDTDSEGATASTATRRAYKMGFDFNQCGWTFLAGCSAFNVHLKGAFEYNHQYAWWKDWKPHPSCPYSSHGGSISLNRCDWVGKNHQPYGGGYHISAQVLYHLDGFIGLTFASEQHMTVYMYGSGYVNDHNTDCICNPLPKH